MDDFLHRIVIKQNLFIRTTKCHYCDTQIKCEILSDETTFFKGIFVYHHTYDVSILLTLLCTSNCISANVAQMKAVPFNA